MCVCLVKKKKHVYIILSFNIIFCDNNMKILETM